MCGGAISWVPGDAIGDGADLLGLGDAMVSARGWAVLMVTAAVRLDLGMPCGREPCLESSSSGDAVWGGAAPLGVGGAVGLSESCWVIQCLPNGGSQKGLW